MEGVGTLHLGPISENVVFVLRPPPSFPPRNLAGHGIDVSRVEPRYARRCLKRTGIVQRCPVYKRERRKMKTMF